MSVKRNFIYNSIITVSGYIFPLLTYPYVSRVLGVSNIGICNFVDSLVNYFVLFSMMGVSAVGIREVAGNKSDRKKLSSTFSSIICLNAITTVLAIVALIAAMYIVPTLEQYRSLLYVGVCKLAFNLFLVEWFYTGLEDFAYITKRTLAIKFLYVAAIFISIHKAEDYPWYYILTVLSVCVNATINIIHSRKFVSLSFRNIDIKPYVRTFLIMGIYLLITNIYTSLNAAWLGFATDTKEVGYYTTATKLYTIIMAFFTAFSNVMFPRVSSLLAENNMEEYWHKIGQAVEALLAFSIPMVVFTCICSTDLIHLLSGDGYEGAYLPFQIIAPLMFVIGYEQIIVLQILLANKQETILLRNSIIGAAVAIASNLLLVKSLGATGSAITWLLSELMLLILSLIAVTRKYGYTFPLGNILKYIIAYFPLGIILISIESIANMSDILLLIIQGSIMVVYTIAVQMLYLRNEIVVQLIKKYIPS